MTIVLNTSVVDAYLNTNTVKQYMESHCRNSATKADVIYYLVHAIQGLSLSYDGDDNYQLLHKYLKTHDLDPFMTSINRVWDCHWGSYVKKDRMISMVFSINNDGTKECAMIFKQAAQKCGSCREDYFFRCMESTGRRVSQRIELINGTPWICKLCNDKEPLISCKRCHYYDSLAEMQELQPGRFWCSECASAHAQDSLYFKNKFGYAPNHDFPP